MRIILDGSIWTNITGIDNADGAIVTIARGVDQRGIVDDLLLIIHSKDNKIVVTLKPGELHRALHAIDDI